MIAYFANFLKSLRKHYLTRLLLLSILVGVAAGLGALAFNFILNSAVDFFMGHLVGYHLPTPSGEAQAMLRPRRRIRGCWWRCRPSAVCWRACA